MNQLVDVKGISRRQFLKGAAAAMGGAAILNAAPTGVRASGPATDPSTAPATLADITRCVGCGNCQRACGQVNDLQPSEEEKSKLSAQTFTYIDTFEVAGATRHAQRQCMHCVEPACVAVCTVGALQKTPDGLVICDTSKCIGCRYCQYACPFGVPTFEWDNPLGLIRKCTFCQPRVEQGESPACVASCPAGALRFGTRAEMLAVAHRRIEAYPERYVNHVYGEHEVGGTTRLYISDVPFEQLGFPVLGAEAVREQTEAVMSKTPVVALGVATLATSCYALFKRRSEILQGDHVMVRKEEER